MNLCLERIGAFKLLIQHGASRLKSGVIAVDNPSNILFVTQDLVDPDQGSYTYENPCPDTPTRIARTNAMRATTGQPRFDGIPNITSVPAPLLKVVMPLPHEIEIEDHAYALTILSIWTDKKKANDLLLACGRSGRKLQDLLDHEERKALSEDISLVTGERNRVEEIGLNLIELTLQSFDKYLKDFHLAEMKCPPNSRRTDDELKQMIGNLFIRDPSMRDKWSSHSNQPTIYDHTGSFVSGPPQNFDEAKELAEKLLRSNKVTAGN